MSALIENLTEQSIYLVPFFFFLFGLTSSLHCAGMCGGFAVLASSGKKGSWPYQLGRLGGYLVIASLFSLIGKTLFANISTHLATISWLLIAFLFIYKGLSSFSFMTRLPFHNFYQKRLSLIMSKMIHVPFPFFRSTLIGVSSVFLPCGVLYLALFAILGLGNPYLGVLSIMTFWLGTLPVMHWGNLWLKSKLLRLRESAPKITNYGLIFIGLCLLIYRAPEFEKISNPPTSIEEVNCH